MTSTTLDGLLNAQQKAHALAQQQKMLKNKQFEAKMKEILLGYYSDLEGAQTQTDKEFLHDKITSLVDTVSGGKSFEDITGVSYNQKSIFQQSNTSIPSSILAPKAPGANMQNKMAAVIGIIQQCGCQGGCPKCMGQIIQVSKAPDTALAATVNTAATATPAATENTCTCGHCPKCKAAAAGGVAGSDGINYMSAEQAKNIHANAGSANHNKVEGRSQEQYEKDRQIIADLEQEFAKAVGVSDTGRGDHKLWAQAAEKSDRIRVLDESGTKEIKNAGTIAYKVIEFQSEKYGTVKIKCGGDDKLDGDDDKVISVGGDTAANSVQSGLSAANNPLETFGALEETQDIFGMDEMNSANGYLNDAEMRNLVAAIMLLIESQQVA